jgi:hypothetical protein
VSRFAAVLLAACGLAACGGSSSEDGTTASPAPTPAETAYVDRLRSLCVSAAQAVDFEHYRAFVRGVKRLKVPGTLSKNHQARIALDDRALAALDAQSAPGVVRRAYARDDALDARLGLIDCIWPQGVSRATVYAVARAGPLRTIAPRLERICVDNRARTAAARRLAGNDAAAQQRVAEAGSERLARLVARVPRPTDAPPTYTGWSDALKTVVNFNRLAGEASDGDRAKNLRAQAQRTAAAGHKAAGALGLQECARP